MVFGVLLQGRLGDGDHVADALFLVDVADANLGLFRPRQMAGWQRNE